MKHRYLLQFTLALGLFAVCFSAIAHHTPQSNVVKCPEHVHRTGASHIVVTLAHFNLCLYDAHGRLRLGAVAIGGANWCESVRRPCRTPHGTFTIGTKHGSGYRSSSYPISCKEPKKCGARMPYYLQFEGKRFGIHGGTIPHPPRHVSHGCIRIPKEAAKTLSTLVYEGMRVIVRPY